MRYVILCLVVIVSITLYIAALYLTDWLFQPGRFDILRYLLRSILLLLSLFFMWKALLFVAYTARKTLVGNFIATAGALISVYILLEVVFSFIPVSTGGGNVLLTRNWFNYYWKKNRLGFRDEDPIHTDHPVQPDIVVLGDSYVAGHGIADEDARFSELIEKELDHCVDIYNVSIPGADTYDEYTFLQHFPIRPDLLIVAHTINDLYPLIGRRPLYPPMKSGAGNEFDLSSIRKYRLSPSFFIANSFFLNFMDYLITELQRHQHIAAMAGRFDSFEQFLDANEGKALELTHYKDDSLFRQHLLQIDLFIEYSKKNNIPLLFVLFPKMDDAVLLFTDRYANRPLEIYLNKKGIAAINPTEALLQMSEKVRRAGKFDPHPSEAVHSVVATLIKEHLYSIGWLSNFCN